MKSNTSQLYVVVVIFAALISIVVLFNKNLAAEKLNDNSGFERIMLKFRSVVASGDYSSLSRIKHNEQMFWGQCNTDIGTNVSINEMIEELYADSKKAKITVNMNSGNGLLETEGWFTEYPFIYFHFDKVGDVWQLSGACYDTKRSRDFQKFLALKKQPHDSPPKLPRNGPRVFHDEIALRARIEEIVQFRAFKALIPYATKNMLTLGQCALQMMEKDRIEGRRTSAQEIVNFLEQNSLPSGKIVSSGMHHKTYYETTGWNGEYPYIAFWFSESSKGWQLAGVSYCKTRHFDLFPPLSLPK